MTPDFFFLKKKKQKEIRGEKNDRKEKKNRVC